MALVQCGFPRDDTTDPEVVPMRIVRVHAGDAWFAAVYQSGAKPLPAAHVSLKPGALGNWTVTVEIEGRRLDHRVPQLAALQR